MVCLPRPRFPQVRLGAILGVADDPLRGPDGPDTDSLAPASAGRFTIGIWIAPKLVTKSYRVLAQREMRWLLARWLEIANGEIPKCSAASSIRSWV